LRIGDFTPDEVAELYAQHTAETGQRFTPEAVARAVELTAGQPWLVNALAREVVQEMAGPVAEPITGEPMDEGKGRVSLARATHRDALAPKLTEPRVHRVIEPVLAGELPELDPYDDDLRYTCDLGLIAPKLPVRIANPIYHEVIARVLTANAEAKVIADPR